MQSNSTTHFHKPLASTALFLVIVFAHAFAFSSWADCTSNYNDKKDAIPAFEQALGGSVIPSVWRSADGSLIEFTNKENGDLVAKVTKLSSTVFSAIPITKQLMVSTLLATGKFSGNATLCKEADGTLTIGLVGALKGKIAVKPESDGQINIAGNISDSNFSTSINRDPASAAVK